MRLMKVLVVAILVAAGFANASQGQTVCPHCNRVHAYQTPAYNGLQARAQAEAQLMASRQFKGHVQGTAPGVSFAGVGWSSSSSAPPTCTPGAGTLVADAVARGADGWYRVRYWR